MKYLYNEEKEFCGVSYSDSQTQNATDKPIKPLFYNEKAIFENDKWNYEYKDLDKISLESNDKKCIAEINGKAHSYILLSSGNYVKEKSKDISILIPCYGKSKWIKDCVQSAINQSMKAYEIIVLLMDDESIKLKDEIEKLSDNITCLVSERKNSVVARNYLVENCKTEYFIFLDGDDTIASNFIETVFNDNCSIVFPKKIIGNIFTLDGASSVFHYCIANNLTALLCKEAFYDIKLDEKLCSGGEDTDFILRLFLEKKWKVSYNSLTSYNYNTFTDENALTKKDDFDKSHFTFLQKHYENIKKNLGKSFYRDNKFIDFYKNNIDITDYNKTVQKFNLIDYEERVFYNNFLDLLKESRKKESLSVFDIEKYYVPDDFNDFTYIENRTFDVLFLEVSENPKMIIRKDLQERNVESLLKNYSCFLYEYAHFFSNQNIYKKISEEKNIIVTFELNKECNRDCNYCTQARSRPYKHYSDDEIYERFDMMISHLEKLNLTILPQLMGGEPTLFSDYLVDKIMNRLKQYERVCIITNHDIKNSAWEKYGSVIFYTHLVDWHNLKIKPIGNEMYMIVLCHSDVPYLEEFLNLNLNCIIKIDEYIGENDELKLTDEDKEFIVKLFSNKTNIKSSINANIKTTRDIEYCINHTEVIRADCTALTFCSCCGRNQPLININDYVLQKPDINYCNSCTILKHIE